MTKQPRKRFQGHEVFNAFVRKDWITSIVIDPDAFDALLYMPIETQPTQAQAGHYQNETADDIDTTQETLSYADPMPVVVVDCPDETTEFRTMDNADGALGESEFPLVLRVAYENIPTGAVLEWMEETKDGDRRVWWYVHSSMAYATNGAGILTVCIPCRNFNDSTSPEERETQPAPVIQSDGAADTPPASIEDEMPLETSANVEELHCVEL